MKSERAFDRWRFRALAAALAAGLLLLGAPVAAHAVDFEPDPIVESESESEGETPADEGEVGGADGEGEDTDDGTPGEAPPDDTDLGVQLSGKVFDGFGRVLPNTSLAFFDAATGEPATEVVSDFDGYYSVNLPAGSYTATVGGAFVYGDDFQAALIPAEASNSNLNLASGYSVLGPPAPSNAVAVSLEGPAMVGATLSISEPPIWPWTDAASFNGLPVQYLWFRGTGPTAEWIAEATGASYTVQAADEGHQITLVVRAQGLPAIEVHGYIEAVFFEVSTADAVVGGAPVNRPDTLAPTGPPVNAGANLPPLQSALVEGSRGGVQTLASVVPGSTIAVFVGPAFAGQTVNGWMFSTPTPLGSGIVNPGGYVSVAMPDNASGNHRIAITDSNGVLIGWTSVTFTALDGEPLSGTGAEGFGAEIATAVALIILGGAAMLVAMGRRGVQKV